MEKQCTKCKKVKPLKNFKMKKLFLLFSLLIVLASCGSIERYNEAATKMHPVEDLHEDIDKVYKQLQQRNMRCEPSI